tara:strand:- start:385 stop:684 length:300 start_codon:yes stop_codon:yes gene_type:complete
MMICQFNFKRFKKVFSYYIIPIIGFYSFIFLRRPSLKVHHCFGYFLKGNGKGDFKAIKPSESGVFIKGDTKDLVEINVKAQKYIIITKNDDYIQFLKGN